LETIVDYLVKPIRFERFFKAISKVKEQSKSETSTELEEAVFLNVDKTLHKVVLSDILYIESDRNYISVVTQNKKLTFIDTLKRFVAKLPQENFSQVHKSFVINTNKVEKISGNEIFISEVKIPIGRMYKQDLLKALNIA
jgi:DNA-binding LytR/AlgR family response regulator